MKKIKIILSFVLFSFCLNASDQKDIVSLSEIPGEILYIILDHLGDQDIIDCSLISNYFYQCAKGVIEERLKYNKIPISKKASLKMNLLILKKERLNKRVNDCLMPDLLESYKRIYLKEEHKDKKLLIFFVSALLNYELIYNFQLNEIYEKIHQKKTKYINKKLKDKKNILALIDQVKKGELGIYKYVCHNIRLSSLAETSMGNTPGSDFQQLSIGVNKYKDIYDFLKQYDQKHIIKNKDLARNYSWYKICEYMLGKCLSEKYLKIFDKTLNDVSNFLIENEQQDKLLDDLIQKYEDLDLDDPFIKKLLAIIEKIKSDSNKE